MCLIFLIVDLVCKKYINLLFFRDRNISFYIYCPLKFMFVDIWWSTKVGAKLLFDLVIFSIFSSRISSSSAKRIFDVSF